MLYACGINFIFFITQGSSPGSQRALAGFQLNGINFFSETSDYLRRGVEQILEQRKPFEPVMGNNFYIAVSQTP